MSGIDKANKQEPNYYTILGLPSPPHKDGTAISSDDLRTAYRRTLLLHHPDKNNVRSSNQVERNRIAPADRFTVDQIVQAYETLSDPALRKTYNERLGQSLKDAAVSRQVNAKKFASSTSESYDLEELDYVEDRQLWIRSCRCGDSYTVTETQLEEAAADGEIIVGCHGCSLNIRVTFQAVE